MAELRLPELGENIDKADVAAVLVSVGDFIELDQPVIEVETEKASVEVPADRAGRITELRVKEGDKVKVGQVILVIETVPATAGKTTAETSESRADEAPPRPTDPAPSPRAIRAETEPEHTDARTVVEFPARSGKRPEIVHAIPAAPSVRALARELGVDLLEVTGSGPAGRISRDDVKAHAKRLIQDRSVSGTASSVPPLPDFARWGETHREPLTGVRRATAAAMSTAWTTVPHVTQFDAADITQLESMRRRFNERPDAAGHKLTITAVVIKLVAAALRRFPKFNASIDVAGDAVVYKRYVHVGVAVDTERGLLVPVLRDVERKGLLQVAAELGELAARARTKKIKPDELLGASFTVSNLGGLGTTYFSPIVPWPEVAILGVGRAETRAVHEAGRFEPRSILPLSLSYDHRLIDGADAARFLRFLAEALEQPLLLLLLEDPGR